MIKLKLSPKQNEKLTRALQDESVTRESLQLAQQQHNVTARTRQDIFEMILEAHNVNSNSIEVNGKIMLREGVLELPEKNANARIKKALQTKPGKR